MLLLIAGLLAMSLAPGVSGHIIFMVVTSNKISGSTATLENYDYARLLSLNDTLMLQSFALVHARTEA